VVIATGRLPDFILPRKVTCSAPGPHMPSQLLSGQQVHRTQAAGAGPSCPAQTAGGLLEVTIMLSQGSPRWGPGPRRMCDLGFPGETHTPEDSPTLLSPADVTLGSEGRWPVWGQQDL
jgi:hypothetical protein